MVLKDLNKSLKMYSLYIGGQLIQRHKELSGLTLLQNENARKASYYHTWIVENPDGSKNNIPYDYNKDEIDRNASVDIHIPNGPNGSHFVVKYGLCGIVNY